MRHAPCRASPKCLCVYVRARVCVRASRLLQGSTQMHVCNAVRACVRVTVCVCARAAVHVHVVRARGS